jgi:hypothetical protein
MPISRRQQPADAEVIRVVDRRLSLQRTTVFEVLLDLAVLVVRLDDRRDTAGDDLRLKDAGGGLGDLAIKDDLHGDGSARIQRAKKSCTSLSLSDAQIPASAQASAHERKPLSRA